MRYLRDRVGASVSIRLLAVLYPQLTPKGPLGLFLKKGQNYE